MFASILIRHHFHKFATVNPDTLNFTGDVVTYLGFIGIISAFIIVITAFRRFYGSPYNVSVKTQTNNKTPDLYIKTND